MTKEDQQAIAILHTAYQQLAWTGRVTMEGRLQAQATLIHAMLWLKGEYYKSHGANQ
jgi:predicted small integral membrane protein